MKLKREEKIFICCCLMPALLLTAFFMLIPLIRGLGLSLTDATATSGGGDFIGMKNYADLLRDRDFYLALKNTFILILVIPLLLNGIALILAFLLTQVKLRESGFYRFLFFFPSIISATAMGVLWSNVFSPTMGFLKKLGEAFGVEAWEKAAPLGDKHLVLIAVIIAMVLQSEGYYMVMYIASIDGIDASVFEAATLDGCGIWKKIIYITLPILRNMIGVTIVLSLSGTLGLSYVITSVITKGGPAGASTVILYYMYQQAFEQSNFGYAMSIAVVTLILAFLLSKLSRKVTVRTK